MFNFSLVNINVLVPLPWWVILLILVAPFILAGIVASVLALIDRFS